MSQQLLEARQFGVSGSATAPYLRPDALTGAYVRVVKPVLDRTIGVVLCLLALPLLLMVAAVVRVSLGPGVLYRQERVGRNGQTFDVLKFRTMLPDRRAPRSRGGYTGADRRVCHKRADDPRHTTVGRFLRKTSLDELPQLVNVALGHMSLVGPRPELATVVEEHYEPWQHKRHWVKPGITGMWQISVRDDSPMYLHTDVDLEYIERIGLRTDLSILLKTVPSLVKRVGS